MQPQVTPGRKLGYGAIGIGALILAALVFVLVSVLQEQAAAVVDIKAGSSFRCTVLSVYDGDGPINCSEVDSEGKQVMVRLRGVEARENDNSCQYKANCPIASGAEAKAELTRLAVGQLSCTSFGPSYNRVDSSCRNAEMQDLSCEMIRRGKAVRWPEYDPDGTLIRCIPGKGPRGR